MKAPVILLFTNDPFVGRVVEDAVLETRHGLRRICTSHDAFQTLQEGIDDADLAIVDLDPGMHGTALLEAMADRLPVIVITSLEENYLQPIASRRGARACLAKPFSAERLAKVIETLLQPSTATAKPS